MAKIDLTKYLSKVDNEGTTPEGELNSAEFREIIRAIIDNQGGMKKLIRNGVEYTPDADGTIEMTILSDSDLPAVRLLTSDNRDHIISTDGSVVLHLRYTSVVTKDGISEDTGHDGTLLIQRKLSTDTEWLSVAELPITPMAWESESYRDVDISSYLLDGDQQLRLRVTDNDAHVDSTWLTFDSVVKTQLAVEFVSSWQNAIPGGAGTSTILSYILLGAVEKELHLIISGKTSGGSAATREIILTNNTIAAYTGRNNPFSYTLEDIASEACKVMSVHGVHTIEAWLQAVADETIQSEHIFSQIFIDCDPEDTDAYLLLQGVISTAQNYVTTDILKYAVHSPSGDAVPLLFTVGNFAGTAEYMRYEAIAENGIQYTLHNTIEVEGDGSTSISTYLRVTSDEVDMLTPSIGADVKLITIDNSVNFAPTSGADFFLNPKTRNNTEDNPARILNAAQGNAPVAASFRNFGFQNDGWVTDSEGQKCLRIRAGQFLDITGYEPFQAYIDAGRRYNNQQASCSIELDMAVRNITDEDDPIIRMCSYLAADGLPLGLEMKPLEGVFMTRSQRTFGQQNFGWSEGVRTHIVINCYYNLGAAAANETQVSYVRIFINGIINREFLFDHTRANEFWQNDGQGNPSSLGIRIGQEEADIDIYGIRIYQKALSSDDIQQNYVSTMPSAADKLRFKEENDIMQDGVISYAKAAAKYNVVVWHGEPVSGHNQDTKADKYGSLYIQLRDSSGEIDRAHSGTLTSLRNKGQGTTAKHYYEWNDQWQWPTKGQGSFVDLNGDDHGQKYQLSEGLPWAKKLVGKINYASSMQSHKAGACNLYNDLYMRIVTDWSVPKQEGYENTRVTVPELPVLYFVQREGDTSPVFQGLMTFGPGKADKPTWGYNEDDFPMMAMMEGSDNNFPLTDQRVPWRDEEVTYNPGEEYFEYNGEGNIDFDLGRVDEVLDGSGNTVEVPVAEVVAKYAAAWNYCYRWNPLITYYDGTIEELRGDLTVNTKLFYWVTKASAGARKFDLFRLDYQGKDGSNNDITEWVPAGLTKTGGVWDSLNLMDDTPVADTSIWDSMNEDFIAARVAQWKAGASTYFSILSLQFHQTLIKLLAGTDNRSKNTYYVLDPITQKIHLHADDLDTILRTNNTGWQLKPYYIEEHDTDDAGNTFWEGQYNVLFKLTELAYAEALPQMMNTVLSNMAALVGSGVRDRAGNAVPQTPEGCFQKYFFSVQEYFPAVTYNETARIRYELAQLAVARNEFAAPDGINPITQSLGDQLEAEKQYIKRRLVYLSSYAAYGEFAASGTDGSLSIRGMRTVDGADAPMVLTIKTHQWLYPTGATGGSLVNPHVRLAPGGRLVDKDGHPYGPEGYQFNIGTIIGDTSCKLSGINYMRSLGNVASLSTNPAYAFTVSGERLVEFIAEPAEGQAAQFRPSSLQVVAPNLRTFSLKGCALIAGECSLAAQTRLQSADLRGTGIVGVVLPESETLTEAHLPSKLDEVVIANTPNLDTLTIEGFDYMQAMSFTGNTGSFDLLSIVQQAQAAGAPLVSFTAENVSWTDVQASLMDWLVSMANSTITGDVSIAGANTAVTFSLKRKFLKKWGQVDNASNPLYITYSQRDLVQVLISGDSNVRTIGAHAFDLTPATVGGVSTPYGNKFTDIAWSLSNNIYATVNPTTGVVTANSLGQENADGTGPTAVLTVTVTLIDGTTMTATKTLRLYDRSARVGDYVFADGTYSDINDGTKTPIGICYYINPEDHTERMMVAMNNANGGTYWGLFNNSSYPAQSIPDIVLETGYNAYDTPMTNVTSGGIVATTEGGTNSYISDETYRDESDTGDADGFRKLAAGSAATHIGFTTLPTAFHGLPAGSRIPFSLYETLQIIDHRDEVLGQLGYDIPVASANETESQALSRLIAAIQTESGEAKYGQFYYPAASFAHAYEPTILRSGEELADKFKAGKWGLPSAGDLARLYWYHTKGYDGAEHAIFSEAAQSNLFTRFSASYFWSSLEFSAAIAWCVYFSTGIFDGYYKYSTCVVRAVAAF